jgi:hypothetical protein
MEKEKNDLIKEKDRFFKRIADIIKSFFKKEEVKQDENINNEDDSENIEFTEEEYKEVLERMANAPYTKVPEYDYKNDIDPEVEKARVRKLYQEVKDGIVDIENLSAVDTILINTLLKSELDITRRKLT